MLKNIFMCVSLIMLSSAAFAGKKHVGEGESRSEACAAAESKAENAARNSGLGGTCYDACSYENCEIKGQGQLRYWACTTWSANHRGSCEKDPSKIRVYED